MGLANLVLYPIAGKLRELIREYVSAQFLLVEGLVAIAEGEHPKVIEARLNSLAGIMR